MSKRKQKPTKQLAKLPPRSSVKNRLRLQKKPWHRTRNWQPSRAVIIYASVVTVGVVLVCGLKMGADSSASTYFYEAREKRAIVARNIAMLSNFSKRNSAQTPDIAIRLQNKLSDVNANLAGVDIGTVTPIPLAGSVSTEYEKARNDVFAGQLAELKVILKDIELFGIYQVSLQQILENPLLARSVTGEESAEAQQRIWQDTAKRIGDIKTEMAALDEATAAVQKHSVAIAKTIGGMAPKYKANDPRSLEKSKATLEKQLAVLRRDAELFDVFRDTLNARLTTVLANLF